ncbi:protein FAM110A-like [Rhinophrynus dorsalis]
MPYHSMNKGPWYSWCPSDGVTFRPSAVEQLEADKAKYVKSIEVVSKQQQKPLRTPLSRQPLFSPGVQGVFLTPNSRLTPSSKRVQGRGAKDSLNIDILIKLINIGDSPLKSPRAECGLGQEQRTARKADIPTTPSAHQVPRTAAVRRVDVMPGDALPSTQCPAIHVSAAITSPARSGVSSDSSLCSPKCTPSLQGKRKTSLHRSKSDLSDHYSRANANLELFFNYCGLDSGEVETIGAERFGRASSDIVSVRFHSESSPSSECAQSHLSGHTQEDIVATRSPYRVSIIERNARVIKWLYGLRQARETQQKSIQMDQLPRGCEQTD